jgi:hypothetical protein
MSLDRGITWSWLGAVDGDAFVVDVPSGCEELRLSMGMPYATEQLERFLAPLAGRVERTALCRSRKGREVPLLRIGRAGAPRRVLATARHHACEMMASYALEGLIASALADDATGRWFGAQVELLVVPFVDGDGVEDGDQGKNRRPRDHNRDYAGEALYPETAALRELLPRWAAPGLDAALDVHCPWIRGDGNESSYQVGSSFPAMWSAQREFAAALAGVNRSPIPYDPADDLPFGQSWNRPGFGVGTGRSMTTFLAALPGTRLSSSFELPYAVARGATVDQQSARAFGVALAAGLHAYLA